MKGELIVDARNVIGECCFQDPRDGCIYRGNSPKITPSALGLPTIYDKDFLIYAISQVMARLNPGEQASPRLHRIPAAGQRTSAPSH